MISLMTIVMIIYSLAGPSALTSLVDFCFFIKSVFYISHFPSLNSPLALFIDLSLIIYCITVIVHFPIVLFNLLILSCAFIFITIILN